MPLGFHSAATICSHLSARNERNRKLLRLCGMTVLAVDDTPSPPVTVLCVPILLLQAPLAGTVCGAGQGDSWWSGVQV